jgi:hypothetical protein
VVAEDHDPILFTMINPSREKGMMVVARLAEELSVHRPDIPLLFIESRGSGVLLVAAGLGGRRRSAACRRKRCSTGFRGW